MDRDMGALVRAVVKDMQWNRPVEKIAKRQGVPEESMGMVSALSTPSTSKTMALIWVKS